MQAVMLVTPDRAIETPAPAGVPIAAGPGCHLCPREGCAARR
jgi:predicted transcriptional regulator